jgi:transposase
MHATMFAQGNHKTIGKLESLRKAAHAEKAPKVALRLQGIMMSIGKHCATSIASMLHVHRATVLSWITAWNMHRETGLLEGHRCGRPQRLSAIQKETLQDIVESGPVAYGLQTGVWSSKLIRKIIADEFDVEYHPGHVRKLLKEMGFSVQRPTTILARADPVKQNRWVRYSYPNLKKKPKKKGR